MIDYNELSNILTLLAQKKDPSIKYYCKYLGHEKYKCLICNGMYSTNVIISHATSHLKQKGLSIFL